MAGPLRAISIIRFSALLCVSLLAAGCAAYIAANQPEKKDLEVLEVGTHRSEVVAELGDPILRDVDLEDYHCHDTYFFTQGYSFPARAGRTLFHTAADVFTIGLWELVGTPAELFFDGTDVRMEVLYDENDRVDSVCVLSGEKVVRAGRIVSKEEIDTRLHEDQAPPRLDDQAPSLPDIDDDEGFRRVRVGLLPILSSTGPTIYRQGFKEGFNRLYLDPAEMGTSNSAGDIVLLGMWILSIPVGIVGGIVEESDDPSPEEIERVGAILRKKLPEFDVAAVLREKI